MPFDVFPCDLCGSSEAVEIQIARHYTNNQPIDVCTTCGFVYVKERRTAKEIADTWSNEIYGEGYTARIPAVKARQTFVADFIDVNVGLKEKDVCDIGAGEGQFLEILKRDYGARPFGIESSKANCRRIAKLGFGCFNGTIEDYCASQQAESYKADIVTITWTLENCRSCKDMLAGAYRILRTSGFVVVATGSRILVPFKKPLHLYLSKNPADTHAFRFSANTLKGILSISSFEVLYVNRYLDSDILCMVAQKRDLGTPVEWEKDDYRKVVDFFERWHKESRYYELTL